MEYSVISSDEQLIDFRRHLHRNKIEVIAMDFECEFNLHCYGEKLCLVQIYDGVLFYIIDPFFISNTELKKTLESRVIKLCYGATSDRKLVYNQYGIRIHSLLDLSLLVSVLGFENRGLDSVLRVVLGVELKKKSKFQKHNWTIRPIAEDAVLYALSDVKYLYSLKDRLINELKRRDMMESLAYGFAQSYFDYTTENIPRAKKKPDYRSLNPGERLLFDKLFDIRDEIAKRIDRPPHYVIDNQQLYSIARSQVSVQNIVFGKKTPNSEKERFLLAATRLISKK